VRSTISLSITFALPEGQETVGEARHDKMADRLCRSIGLPSSG
jgi:hypothetical protein